MKKMLLSVLMVVAMVGAANALTFTDTTYFTSTGTNDPSDYVGHGRGDVNFLEGPSLRYGFDFVSWKHQFSFNPPAAQILSGQLTLFLKDDSYDPWYQKTEWAFGKAEDGSWDIGEVDTGAYKYGVDVSYLSDGVFGVYLKSVLGDFYICKSELTVDYAPVPEPATMLLLGSGLVGLVGYGRKKFKK